jgi:hypothetical protein
MMLRKSLACVALLTCAALLIAADDKKDDKPALSGVWAMKQAEMKLKFADKNTLKISPHGKDEVILLVCEYSVDKNGMVKAKITDYAGRDDAKQKLKEALPQGLEFTFNWKVKGDAATLDGVKGEHTDLLKSHLEGEYEKK